MATSVILTTYNQPRWLELALLGYARQTLGDFEIVVADDGSDDDTREVIEGIRRNTGLNLQHVWQRDAGFRKCRILNKAILACRGDYLVFSDGDCVPRCDFLQAHLGLRKPGYFLSGGYVKLSKPVSACIDASAVESGLFARRRWLIQNGLGRFENLAKLGSGPWSAWWLNRLSRTRAGWHGHNASCWKRDALSVGGFDERMGWGGEDREFGYRLVNAGVRPRRIRYSAICVHLHHERPWRDEQVLARNDDLRRRTRQLGICSTDYGIRLTPHLST